MRSLPRRLDTTQSQRHGERFLRGLPRRSNSRAQLDKPSVPRMCQKNFSAQTRTSRVRTMPLCASPRGNCLLGLRGRQIWFQRGKRRRLRGLPHRMVGIQRRQDRMLGMSKGLARERRPAPQHKLHQLRCRDLERPNGRFGRLYLHQLPSRNLLHPPRRDVRVLVLELFGRQVPHQTGRQPPSRVPRLSLGIFRSEAWTGRALHTM